MTDTIPSDPNAQKHGLILPERVYDFLKDLNMIALPTIVAAFGGFAQLWGVPEDVVAKIVGTIAFVIVVIGVILKISNVRYQKNAEIAAIKAAAIDVPSVRVSETDATKVVVTGVLADPEEVEVTGGSQ